MISLQTVVLTSGGGVVLYLYLYLYLCVVAWRRYCASRSSDGLGLLGLPSLSYLP